MGRIHRVDITRLHDSHGLPRVRRKALFHREHPSDCQRSIGAPRHANVGLESQFGPGIM